MCDVARLHDLASNDLDDDRFHPGESTAPCEWSGFPVRFGIIDDYYDYEADDVLIVEDPKQLRALGDEFRAKIVFLLRERAASITELAQVLSCPKGTAGHHVKVLEQAGLVEKGRSAQWRPCHLNTAPLAEADAWMAPYRSFFETRFARLAEQLANERPKEDA